jgi:hypothetical protein
MSKEKLRSGNGKFNVLKLHGVTSQEASYLNEIIYQNIYLIVVLNVNKETQ